MVATLKDRVVQMVVKQYLPSRDSHPVLREPNGEVPLGYSPGDWGLKNPGYPIGLVLPTSL
jgi:hypothetical protein